VCNFYASLSGIRYVLYTLCFVCGSCEWIESEDPVLEGKSSSILDEEEPLSLSRWLLILPRLLLLLSLF